MVVFPLILVVLFRPVDAGPPAAAGIGWAYHPLQL
jgi:hypothetical protein